MTVRKSGSSNRNAHRVCAMLALAVLAPGLILVKMAAIPALAAAPSDSFVTRQGNRLLLDGRPFRFGGANIYWLGLDENVGGITYPTHFRIDDALATARDMGT